MFDPNSLKEQISEKQMSDKREELEQIAQTALFKCLSALGVNEDSSNLTAIAREVVRSFIKITPPETDITMKMLVLSEAGRRGGSSTKPGNLLLN